MWVDTQCWALALLVFLLLGICSAYVLCILSFILNFFFKKIIIAMKNWSSQRRVLYMQESSKDLNLRIDIYDEIGIVGGASGISGGLLHPYSPKGYMGSL